MNQHTAIDRFADAIFDPLFSSPLMAFVTIAVALTGIVLLGRRLARNGRREELHWMRTYGYVRPFQPIYESFSRGHVSGDGRFSGHTLGGFILNQSDELRYRDDLAYVRQLFGPHADGCGNGHTRGNALPMPRLSNARYDL